MSKHCVIIRCFTEAEEQVLSMQSAISIPSFVLCDEPGRSLPNSTWIDCSLHGLPTKRPKTAWSWLKAGFDLAKGFDSALFLDCDTFVKPGLVLPSLTTDLLSPIVEGGNQPKFSTGLMLVSAKSACRLSKFYDEYKPEFASYKGRTGQAAEVDFKFVQHCEYLGLRWSDWPEAKSRHRWQKDALELAKQKYKLVANSTSIET